MKVTYVNSIIYVCSKYCSSKRCYFSKGCTRKGRNLKEFSRSLIPVLTDSYRSSSFVFFIITDSLICFFQEYLARLEAIRRQNFQERKEIQRRMAGVRAPVTPSAQVLHHFWRFSSFCVPWKLPCWPSHTSYIFIFLLWGLSLFSSSFFLFLLSFFKIFSFVLSPATDQMLFVTIHLTMQLTPSFSVSKYQLF